MKRHLMAELTAQRTAREPGKVYTPAIQPLGRIRAGSCAGILATTYESFLQFPVPQKTKTKNKKPQRSKGRYGRSQENSTNKLEIVTEILKKELKGNPGTKKYNN
jgi:hypothetical protein